MIVLLSLDNNDGQISCTCVSNLLQVFVHKRNAVLFALQTAQGFLFLFFFFLVNFNRSRANPLP